jgi:hypothetical protein
MKTDEAYDEMRRKRDVANTANIFLEKALAKAQADLDFVTAERDRLDAQLQAEQRTMRDVIIDNSTNNNASVDEVMRLRKLLQDNGIEIGG